MHQRLDIKRGIIHIQKNHLLKVFMFIIPLFELRDLKYIFVDIPERDYDRRLVQTLVFS